MLKRHEGAFDPYTRHVASGGRDQRLLTLDGAQKHVKVGFLEPVGLGTLLSFSFQQNERQVPTPRRQYLQHP